MRKIVILILLGLSIGISKAQEAELVKYKSSFTLNFIRYVGWPDAAKEGDFIIGVLKNSAIADNLKLLSAGKKNGYQNIVIKEFKSVEEITYCQILYIDGNINYGKNAEIIASKLNNKNTLIITDSNGAISKGAMINFVIVDDKLKFEVSGVNAEKFGLKMSSTLLSMNNAIKV